VRSIKSVCDTNPKLQTSYPKFNEKTNKLGKQGKEHSVDFPKTMLYGSFGLPNEMAALFYGIVDTTSKALHQYSA
jgi:hypothetical protein